MARRRAESLRHRQMQDVGEVKEPEGGWSQNLEVKEGYDIFGAPLERGYSAQDSDSEAAAPVSNGADYGIRGGDHGDGHGHRVDRPEIPLVAAPSMLDIETSGRTPWLGRLLCVGVGDMALRPIEGSEVAAELLASPEIVVCHTSFDLRWLGLSGMELHPELSFHDTRVMAWLLDENRSLALDDLCMQHLGYKPPKLIRSVSNRLMFESKAGLVPLDEAPWNELAAYNESDLRATAELYDFLRTALMNADLWDLFLADEVPLSGLLVRMEIAGLPFNESNRVKLREMVQTERDELAEKLLHDGGLPDSFKLSSTKQVATYLFGHGTVFLNDRLALDAALQVAAKEAKAYGGDPAEVLNELELLPKGFVAEKVGRLYAHGYWKVKGRKLNASEHGFGSSSHWREQGKKHKQPSTGSIALVLNNPTDAWVADFVLWRELSKLDSSFLSKFPNYVNAGRLHGTINRTGTATGRFSSSEPNLQQIPAHGQYGAQVRALFEGPLVVGDYSQLEQRVAAHFSQDERLLEAYHNNVDLYGLAASVLFGGEPTKDHLNRGLMKTGMLALQYGAGAGKLAQLILIDNQNTSFSASSSVSTRGQGGQAVTLEMRMKAQELIDQLHEVFPRFFEWRREVIAGAVRDEYVETIGGRRRRLNFAPGWLEAKQSRRELNKWPREAVAEGFALERQAVNAVCQGGAADIVARSMVNATQRLTLAQALLLIQVHDEVLWERGPDWDDGCLDIVRECMEVGHGFKLHVPLAFDAKEVTSWAEKGGSITNIHNLFSSRMKRNRQEGLQSRKASDLSRARTR
jgi:DNA polymerase I-like protein with 3'-5' exonuclease and polymerase domains